MSSPNDVVITGIGILSSLGEGAEANWAALREFSGPVLDSDRFAPYTVHPLPEIDWSQQIAKRGDQRQMEAWQRIGTYTAGLALDDAGIKGDGALCASMDMIVAASGGERDVDVDAIILARAAEGVADVGVAINEVLTTELRPTLFLAQLSNLLAGNISIVHKVTGSSRTFMGEEGSGISAIQTAAARIRAGQSTHALVGAAYNAEHPDMLLGYELGHYLSRGGWAPVWDRAGLEGGGIVSGSGGAFLVLESREHAERRGARIHATLGPVAADQGPLESPQTKARLDRLAGETGLATTGMIVSSTAGSHARTADEKAFLETQAAGVPVRGIASALGHMRDVQFPMAVALAALSVSRGEALPPLGSDYEAAADTPSSIGVLTIGFNAAEGMAVVTGAKGGGA
ncbi:MAG: beta-ketoacyl-ACP synthase [Oricola sp.]